MQSLEYKTVKVEMKGIFKRDIGGDLDSVLNEEGKEGWRLVDSIIPAGGYGQSDSVILIFMREKE